MRAQLAKQPCLGLLEFGGRQDSGVAELGQLREFVGDVQRRWRRRGRREPVLRHVAAKRRLLAPTFPDIGPLIAGADLAIFGAAAACPYCDAPPVLSHDGSGLPRRPDRQGFGGK